MNDEPHSHKKATVAVVTILLLAYVGSYLGMWLNPSLKSPTGIRVILLDQEKRYVPSPKFLDYFYWPLSFLAYKATGTAVYFISEPIAGADWGILENLGFPSF